MGFVRRVIAEQLGFQYFALTQHVDVVAAGSGVIHIHNYPDRWADFYAANALGITDPVHRACHMTSWGFRWTQMPALIPLTSGDRSEEHTSELQSLMRISYAVFCLKKKKT